MNQLNSILNDLETKIKLGDSMNESISKSNVLWQINHSFMVVNEVSKVLQLSDPKNYQWKFNKTRFLVFLMNKIPRGKAKAPEKAKPIKYFNQETTKILFQDMMSNLQKVQSLDKNANFKHPFFGLLNKKSTLKFLYLHTNHHAKIVNEILNEN